MNVFLPTFDLFRSMGGGQTFYRSLIENNPQIQFHYLIENETADTIRPANAAAIPYRHELNWAAVRLPSGDLVPKWVRGPFIDAQNIAASVAGRAFDVVDLPDFSCAGAFLRPALIAHGVQFKSIVLSLHGTISRSVQLNWGTEGTVPTHLIEAEKYQYLCANVRYGISAEYLDECRETFKIAGGYLDPLRFFKIPKPKLAPPSGERPDLVFIGRTEKRKGPDLFIQLVQHLPPDSFRRAHIIGPECFGAGGDGSTAHLKKLAKSRGLEDRIVFEAAKTSHELDEIFAGRTLTILPSKYDTLNLVALESLLAGCPTAIGTGAGAVRYLKESFTDVPFIEFDVADPAKSVYAVEACLNDYDAYRRRLCDSLKTVRPVPTGLDLAQLYRMPSAVDAFASDQVVRWYSLLIESLPSPLSRKVANVASAAVRLVAKRCPARLRRRLRPWKNPYIAAKNAISSRLKRLSEGKMKSRALLARAVLGADRKHNRPSDSLTPDEVHLRHSELSSRGGASKLDRLRTWSELAELEEIRGNEEIALSYRLRRLRLSDDAPPALVDEAVEKLAAAGYKKESVTAAAMFGPKEERHAACAALLRDQYERCLKPTTGDWELFDDRRTLESPRVSVIVSLYDAASKLPRFLSALSLQTAARKGEVEVVLVDSGSPGAEYAAFQSLASELKLSIVYARSPARETIQSAWNRGIGLARGEYLSFLGVDEALFPDALEVLSRELDTNADVDWVTGSSLVTEVNADGQWLYDSFIYDRTGFKDQLVLLETCYLSWVGALYRKSLHERFGYYDSTFRAAGDTEFKNRVMPFIKTKFVPRQLGVFWNYPSERTTAHPRAEIEDLRAWYLHRTMAGVEYAVQRRDSKWAEDLFKTSLGYRKSYCGHYSTDIDLAYNVAAHLSHVAPESAAARCQMPLLRLQQAYQRLDLPPKGGRMAMVAGYRNLEARRKQFAIECSKHMGDYVVPTSEWFSDNRFEQHHWIWYSEYRSLRIAPPETELEVISTKKIA